ncbi:MAG: FeoB-associated Cys-rich membrane protein [Firmicutes bacterium]|nr:FeoB-associated Cys-rich membrane protein [Bacillota bacterium]
MSTIIAILVIAVILFLAIRYIYKEKKKGHQCIGCPFADSCQKHNPPGNSCS